MIDTTSTPKPEPDFWAIVALTFDETGRSCEAYVLRESPDCKDRDIFVDGIQTSDNGDRFGWAKNLKPGVYRISLHPFGGYDSFDLGARLTETLYELPA